MNDFTKEELQYFLMTMKPFHFLWRHDPLELERKIQSMIENYAVECCSCHRMFKEYENMLPGYSDLCSECNREHFDE